jgi:Alginate export
MMNRSIGLAALFAVLASPALAQSPPRDPLRFETPSGFVKLGVEAGIQIVGESRSFWDLGATFAPGSGYNPDMGWAEGYVKPSVDFEHRFSGSVGLYGGLSVVASGTASKDILDFGDTGRLTLENGFLGLRHGTRGQGFFLDVSAGAQPYRVGSGMLISDGGSDGFERGTLIFGPRQAWAMTGIARIGYGPVSVDAFYLDANELKSSDTGTTLAGAKVEWSLAPNQFVGLAVARVLESTAPWAQAAPGGIGAPVVLLDARDGLSFLNAYGRINPAPAALPGLWIAGDIAYQRDAGQNMEAWGGRIEAGYAFAGWRWTPVVTYGWQTFSGDDPNTTKLERFDPLFYDGGQAGWASGTNGSFVFINSNINAHRLSVNFTITPQDLLTLRYAHVRANELNSPIQFGQATRLGISGGSLGLISGVTKAHLSDDFLVEYTRVLSANAFLTVGAGYSIPGAGLKAAAAPNDLDNWIGGFANLVVKY